MMGNGEGCRGEFARGADLPESGLGEKRLRGGSRGSERDRKELVVGSRVPSIPGPAPPGSPLFPAFLSWWGRGGPCEGGLMGFGSPSPPAGRCLRQSIA